MHFFFQVPQDLARAAAAPHARSHKHALNLRALLVDWPESTAPDGLIPLLSDDEISTGSFKFGFVNPTDQETWVQCGNLRIQLAHQDANFLIYRANRNNYHA
jgi:hypothetical protein